MSTIDQCFQQLRARGDKAFIPFVTAGDPDLELTQAVLRELDGRGVSLCEVGVPYSDPIADGPVIQASYTRALQRGIRLNDIFASLSEVTGQLTCPVVTMVSYAIIYRHGLAEFIQHAKQSGIEGAIVPDLLVEESQELAKLCADADFSLVQLVTPTTPRERAVRIAERSSGFLYYVSVTGITGERNELSPDLIDNVQWLRTRTDLPICIGFGISQAEHVRQLKSVADGIIVGSALVRRVARLTDSAESDPAQRAQVVDEIGRFAEELMDALRES